MSKKSCNSIVDKSKNNVTLINAAGRLCTRLHQRYVTEMSNDDLKQSAVIFAPHEDDETLACGGTIIKKMQAGAKINLVFLTDGSRSHSCVISKSKLREMRKQEALKAAKVLGLDSGNIMFMPCENGRLAANQNEMCEEVKDILQRFNPEHVYIPCGMENIPDHLAANRIVLAALMAIHSTPMVYEYPVWAWLHWPWVGIPLTHPMRMLEMMRLTVMAGFGLRMMSKFRSAVYIGDVLDRKRLALANHRTQMFRMIPRRKWPILSDVARGEFIRCFFQNYELFYRYRMKAVEEEVGWPMANCVFPSGRLNRS
jgi:LmbE family N-acetylglucosaminyl deacetylase